MPPFQILFHLKYPIGEDAMNSLSVSEPNPLPNSLLRKLFHAFTGEYFWFYILLLPSILILVGLVIIPMLFTLRMSLANTSVTVIGGHGSLSMPWSGINNYIHLFQSPDFWQSFRETLFFWLASILIEVTVGVAIAVLMNQQFLGQRVFRIIVFIPWAIPTVVNSMMWGMIMDGNNYGALNDLLLRMHVIKNAIVWLNPSALFPHFSWLSHVLSSLGMNTAILSIIVGDEWHTLPIVVVLVLAGLQTIPVEYYEAARVEGATGWRKFRSITLPLLGPILSVVLILRTMQLLRAFTMIYTLEQFGLPVLSIQAYQQAFSFGSFGLGAATSFIIGLVALFISYIYIKRLYKEEL
ncbi:sugar ABC transporter permease [Alicyclobacillaceae bacterium I2511]|nr:sugar ABC transporter permease [Alicyclobacillaceae bacterium I2511]